MTAAAAFNPYFAPAMRRKGRAPMGV